MTPELKTLAGRAIACPAWRWMPGMLAQKTTHPSVQERGGPQTLPVRFVEGLRFAEGFHGPSDKPEQIPELADPYVIELIPSKEVLTTSAHATIDGWHRVVDLLPDLTDPATLGCLLSRVREAWNSPLAQVSPMIPTSPRRKQNWAFYINDDNDRRFFGYTEAEALIAALEAAPAPDAAA